MNDKQCEEFRRLAEESSMSIGGVDGVNDCENMLLKFMTPEFAIDYSKWKEKLDGLVKVASGRLLTEGKERKQTRDPPTSDRPKIRPQREGRKGD